MRLSDIYDERSQRTELEPLELFDCHCEKGPVFRRGTVSGHLQNGDLVLGEIYEEPYRNLKRRFRRYVVYKGMRFYVKGPLLMDTFEALESGETVQVDAIESGLSLVVTLEPYF